MKKGVEHEDVASVLKSVTSLDSDQKRLEALAARLVTAHAELRSAREKASAADRLGKEKSALEKQLATANSVLLKAEEKKDKLEELCRGLQQLNKEESVARAKKMEADREQMVNQLKASMDDIQKSMEEGRERSEAVASENARLSSKLGELAADYESRVQLIAEQFKQKEKYCEELCRAKDVELDLYRTKLEASGLVVQKLQIEKEVLDSDAVARASRVDLAIENEKLLKQQIAAYGEKYAALNKSLDASNETFAKFRAELDKVNKNLRKVEQEAREWRGKWEDERKLVERLGQEKSDAVEKANRKDRQLEQLEKLCRALRQAQTQNGDSGSHPE